MSAWEAQRAQLRPAPAYPRAFTCTEVDMFCAPGSKGSMTLKKVRKDKRESHSSRVLLDDNPRKLKERPSWLSISRQSSSSLAPSGSWRQVTCNLQDNLGQAILQLYTEDQHLQHSVQIHALSAPNLRIVDPTLLKRRHVLAIHGHTPLSAPSTSPTSPASQDPIYLAFRDRDTLNTWLVLLRSFAYPDIRPGGALTGFSLSPTAPYRVWRQLQVTAIAGRKFPAGLSLDRVSSDESNGGPRSRDKDAEQLEVFLEVVVNGVPAGRTGTKLVPGPAWHAERIVVPDPDLGGGNWAGSSGVDMDLAGTILDPAWGMSGVPGANSGLLEIRIWRAKPAIFGPAIFSAPSVHMATVPIDLGPFRRGEAIKAWWPGYPVGVRGLQDGELMLEIKFDEEIVMPLEVYRRMKEILARRNYFELWRDITHRIPLPNSVSTHLISLAQHHATLAPHLSALARAEINEPRASPSTLFRGNTLFTRAAELAMGLLGARGFLESSVGGVIRRMYKDKVVFDIGTGGPLGGANVGAAAATEGADLMAYWLQEIWNSIWRARGECPEELRQLFYQIRTHIDARWGDSQDHADLKYQAISAFLFLRFFVPALLRPDQNGLAIGSPPEGVERSLKSLARALQSLANLNTTVQREEFMRSIKTFNEDNVDAMIDYLIFVSTPSERLLSSPTSHPNVHHQYHLPPRESAIHTALRTRLPTMPAIHRESLPTLPHMADEARDLAAIASAIVRNARMPKQPEPGSERIAEQDVGPMGETVEGEQSECCSAGASDACASVVGVQGEGEGYTKSQLDALRFIKACFEVEAEAMRRVSPGMIKKKHPRRRRRPNKMDEKAACAGDGKLGASANASTGPSTPPVEARSPKETEAKKVPSLPAPLSMVSLATYGSLPVPIHELNTKPEIMRQMSHTIASETVQPDATGSKKRKGMMSRFMPGSRK